MKPDLPRLVAAAQQGDAEAWNALVEQFAGLVWHVIRGFRLPNAAAEDVYQTTWLRLAEHLDRIRQPESLGGWLARTARNECLRAVKLGGREHLRDDLDIDLVDRSAAPVDKGVETEAANEILWRAFATLSQACQQLLRLLIAEPPLPYDRISELLGMSIGSIGPTRARCLAKLRTSRGVYLLGGDL
ncbi:MAG: sigma-70 family RNA polymerase sigma factor [Acidimicrobiia bacterium]|nr:sigma-70 family RNA polymerase sigma factor [Acidimicrobiia bacterium]